MNKLKSVKINLAICIALIFILKDYSYSQADFKYISPENYWVYSNYFCFDKETLFNRKFSTNSITLSGKQYYQELYFQNGLRKPSNNLYREEEGKVYLKSTISEDLLIDTKLNVGDSITNISKKSKVIKSIDEVKLIDGSLRKRFTICENCSTFNKCEDWIDGVGFVFEVHNLGCISLGTDCRYHLSCYFSNNTALFSNSNYNSCFLHEINVEKDNRIKVNFNNSTNYLIIENPFQFEINLYILNTVGILVNEVKLNNYVEFSLEHIPIGVYFYIIHTNDFAEIKGKFVKY